MTAALSNGLDGNGEEFFAPVNSRNDPEQNEAIYKHWESRFKNFQQYAIFKNFQQYAIVEHDGFFEDKTPINPVFITIKGAF